MKQTHSKTHTSKVFLSPKDNLKIVVILPCYNEEVSIAETIKGFQKALPNAEIWVVDNNSSDKTTEIALNAGAHILSETRKGKGYAVRCAFSNIDSDIYILADGDGTYESAAAPKMIEILQHNNLDMVVGARITDKNAIRAYRPAHVLGNHFLSKTVQILFGYGFNDMLSGYRVFSRAIVKSMPLNSKGFEIETELTVHCLSLEIPTIEVDTLYFDRPTGSHSKLKTWSDGWRILTAIISLLRHKRPLIFFNIFAFILTLSAIWLFWPVWQHYTLTGQVSRFPTAVLCGFLSLAAMGMVACGIILDQIASTRNEIKKLTWLSLKDQSRKHKHNTVNSF